LSQLVNKLATNLLRKILLTSCWNSIDKIVNKACYKPVAKNLVDKLLEQNCHKLLTKLATNLLQTRLVDKLLEQHCHNYRETVVKL
jgi:hypothetical protein